MESLPLEMERKIMLNLSDKDLFNYCSIHRSSTNIAENYSFWKEKLVTEYNIIFDPNHFPQKSVYKALYKEYATPISFKKIMHLDRGDLAKIAIYKRKYNPTQDIMNYTPTKKDEMPNVSKCVNEWASKQMKDSIEKGAILKYSSFLSLLIKLFILQ
jgi:hypothetical protein